MFLDSSDALSRILQSLGLAVDVYAHGDFCGHWAIDTSGSKRMPFHLVTQGKAWLHRHGQSPSMLTAGDIALFPHDHEHVMSSESEQPPQQLVDEPVDSSPSDGVAKTTMICGFFEFTSRSAWPLLDSLPADLVLDLTYQSQNPSVRKLIELLVVELEQRPMGCFASVNHLAYLLFIEVLRMQMKSGVNSGLLAALADPKIGAALNHMHNAPSKNWSLVSLSSSVGMSRTAFAASFKEKVGMTPMSYLTEWRIREAGELLQNTQRAIIDIAEGVGYTSEAAFRKIFKSVTGCTPSQYRKRLCR